MTPSFPPRRFSDLFRAVRSRPWNYFRGKFTLFRTTLSRISRDRSERAVTIPSLSADGIPLLPLWYGRPLPVPWYIHPAKAGGARSSRPAQRQRLPRPSGDHYRSEEHTSELQSLMRISYAVFCLKKKKQHDNESTKQHQE